MSVNWYDKNTDKLKPLASGAVFSNCPIGTILSYGGTVAPDGYLLCQGQEVSKTDYSVLYAIIGDNFGTASASGMFKLPDLREATVKGAGLTGLSSNHLDADGLIVGEFIDDRLQDHKHMQRLWRTSASSGSTNTDDYNSIDDTSVTSYYTLNVANNARTGATTEVKAVGVNFIIKALDVDTGISSSSISSYSTEETFTGRFWIDGKPIYRKVLTGIFNNGTEVSIANLNIATMVRVDGYTTFTNGYSSPIPYCSPGSGVLADIRISPLNSSPVILFDLAGGWSNNTYHLILEYTKTTD